MSYFLLKLQIITFHTKYTENNIYFAILCEKIIMLGQLANFIFAIKLSFIFQISANFEKILLKFDSLSNALAKLRYNFIRRRGNNLYRKGVKRINLESDRECAKGLLLSLLALRNNRPTAHF